MLLIAVSLHEALSFHFQDLLLCMCELVRVIHNCRSAQSTAAHC